MQWRVIGDGAAHLYGPDASVGGDDGTVMRAWRSLCGHVRGRRTWLIDPDPRAYVMPHELKAGRGDLKGPLAGARVHPCVRCLAAIRRQAIVFEDGDHLPWWAHPVGHPARRYL